MILKRMLAMLLAMVMLLSLVGCGSDSSAKKITKTELNALKEEKNIAVLREVINSVVDFRLYLREMNFPEIGDDSTAEKLLENGGSGEPLAYCRLMTEVLADDYPELGMIYVYASRDNYYYFTYVKEDDTYSLYDPFWMFLTNRQSDDLDELGNLAIEYAQEFKIGRSLKKYEVMPITKEEAPNGMLLTQTINYGVSSVAFAGTTIPVDLGLPKLTDEEIDALLAENDPRKVKETITTLADFANYCYRGKFIFGDGLIFFFEENGYGVQTTSSGYQTLQMRMGQCASMSSCMRYVLDGDYDETGYVLIDQHIMTYILCDGLYYLVNPVEYVSIAYNNYWRCSTWLGDITGGKADGIYCSTDFQDVADSLYGSFIGTDITHVYTITGPGDFVRGAFSDFPEETTATCWYGTQPVNYFSFTEYDWMSQESVVDKDMIVMFPPPEGQRFASAGIHEDSYTAEQYPNSYLK